MHKLRRIDIENRGEVLKKIEDYVKEVVDRLDPHLVVLFGSFATGDINEGSDIDIVVVANFEESFLDRIKILMEMNTFGIPIEPIGYTPEEYKRMTERGNRFVTEILEKGRILHKRLETGIT